MGDRLIKLDYLQLSKTNFTIKCYSIEAEPIRLQFVVQVNQPKTKFPPNRNMLPTI